MIRLMLVVEGQTEESFATRVLAPHLDARNVFTKVAIVATGRDRQGRGGGRWSDWSRDLRRFLRDRQSEARFTTLFDLYGLPNDFPRLDEHRQLTDTSRRAEVLERAMQEEFQDPRFIPYLQRHEFEALVLAGIDDLELEFEGANLTGVRALRAEIGATAPEDIDDGRETAPSRRLQRHVPGYVKLLHGPHAAESVGLQALRQRCPRFGAWVTRLEGLDSGATA